MGSEAAELIKESHRQTSRGSQLAQLSGHAFDEISTQAERVAQLVHEVSSASREQAAGANQLNRVINAIERTIHENTEYAVATSGSSAR